MIKKLLITTILSLSFLFTANAAEYGPVAAKETLWDIASRNRPSYDVTTQQMMLAIRLANPDAFQSDNINTLKAGAILHLPSLNEINRLNQVQALRTAKSHNKAWQQSKKTSHHSKATKHQTKTRHRHSTKSSAYKRYYKASQRELRRLQKQLKREQRKVRHLKQKLAAMSKAEPQQDAKQLAMSAKQGNLVVLQEEVKRLEEIIKQKNTHIAQLENMKAVATETIKKQAEVNQTLFNRLKAIAPDQVLSKNVSGGSLKLEGINDSATTSTTDNKKQATALAAKTKTSLKSTEKNRGDGFIVVIGVLSLLFALALLWRLFAQYSANRNIQKAEEDTATEEQEDADSTLQRKDPLLST